MINVTDLFIKVVSIKDAASRKLYVDNYCDEHPYLYKTIIPIMLAEIERIYTQSSLRDFNINIYFDADEDRIIRYINQGSIHAFEFRKTALVNVGKPDKFDMAWRVITVDVDLYNKMKQANIERKDNE